jgi:hypothetical protein
MANRLQSFNETLKEKDERNDKWGLKEIEGVNEDIKNSLKPYDKEIFIPNSNLIRSNNQLIITGE